MPDATINPSSIPRLECLGVEAAWNHPVRGMVSPGVFIPIAERAGLMSAMGTSILRIAIRQCRVWLDAGLSIQSP